MISDANSQIHEEHSVHKRESAIDFLTGTTVAYDLTEDQRRFFLGQAIELNTLV